MSLPTLLAAQLAAASRKNLKAAKSDWDAIARQSHAPAPKASQLSQLLMKGELPLVKPRIAHREATLAPSLDTGIPELVEPQYSPQTFPPEQHTYAFTAAPIPQEEPAIYKRDIAQDSRRTLDAAGVGGLLGLLLGGGRGAALGAIGASRGFSAGRDQRAQEQQRQRDEEAAQVQQSNARARQIWADQQAQLERQMALDDREDARKESIFQQEEKRRFWDYTQQKEKYDQERARQEREAQEDRALRERIASLNQEIYADNRQLDSRLHGMQRAFPGLDEEIRQVRASLTRMPYQGRDKRGRPITLYRNTTKLEQDKLKLYLEKLIEQKRGLIASGADIRAQRAANEARIGTGR